MNEKTADEIKTAIDLLIGQAISYGGVQSSWGANSGPALHALSSLSSARERLIEAIGQVAQ